MNLHVRQVRVEDAAAIVAILNPIISAGCHTALDTTFTVDEERAFIEYFPARGVFQVATLEDGTIVGMQNVSHSPTTRMPSITWV